MKKLPLFIVAAATGLLIYFLWSMKKISPVQNADSNPGIRNTPGKHNVTDAFETTKDYATTDN